ncbi:MAG: polysaccharide deacetylase family protein, partial [Fibrobacter sp.]|nr:polysaccharide deacetylase family protein [Fibrobacter sp.]
MNFFNKAKTLTLLACAAGVAFAAPTIEIGTWGNFCKGAVTFSFDDNTPKQLSVAQPMFDAKGFRMTLNTATSTMSPNWSGLKNAFAKGHEIASHSVSHVDLSTSSNVDNECKNSKSSIEQNVPGAKCVTIAYPYCNKPSESTLSKYFIAGRTCSGQTISSSETNFFGLSSIICGNQGKNSEGDITGIVNQAETEGKWAVFLIHCIDGGEATSDYSPIASSTIKAVLDKLDTKRSTMWVETFGNIVRYMKERKAATVSVTSS